ALNYLPAHVSSMPAEHVFSSSAEMDMRQCNHISPQLMEKLQTLKYMIKKERLDFMTNWECEGNEI
ncbi:hypothetical protein K439DRAFT_1243767, partial [Ramaria rubella]